MSVHILPTIPRKARDGVIKILTDLLDEAKAGHIAELGFYAITDDAHLSVGYTASVNRHMHIAGAARLMHKLNHDV